LLAIVQAMKKKGPHKMSQEICRREWDAERNARHQSWSTHVKNWKESGLSQTEYCQRAEIKYGTFKAWACKFKEKPEFLPVRIIPSKTTSEIEIRLPGCLSVIVKKDFEEDLLRRVIKSLGGCHV
jgi:hypothetical protein